MKLGISLQDFIYLVTGLCPVMLAWTLGVHLPDNYLVALTMYQSSLTGLGGIEFSVKLFV